MVTPPADYNPHQPLRRGADWPRVRSQWEAALLAGGAKWRRWARCGRGLGVAGTGRGNLNLKIPNLIRIFLSSVLVLALIFPKLSPAARFSLPTAPKPSGASSQDFQPLRSLPRPGAGVEFPTNPWKIPRERVPAQQLEEEEDARLDQTDPNSRRDRRDPAADAQGQEILEPLRDPLEFSGNSGCSSPAVPVTCAASEGFGTRLLHQLLNYPRFFRVFIPNVFFVYKRGNAECV